MKGRADGVERALHPKARAAFAALTQEFVMSDKKSPLSRRQMVAGAGTVGALAAVASALPLGKPQDAAPPADAPRAADGATPGYRLTAHIERYYQTAKV